MTGTDSVSRPGVRWFAVAMTVGQLALWLLGAWSLWVVAGGWWVGAAAAGAFLAVFVAGALIWLAPGSPHRLGYRDRLAVNLIAGTAVAVLASLANVWLPAVVALIITIWCDSLNERSTAGLATPDRNA